MAKGFGQTWWGEHWLKALSKVDYSNRLPRGATYARTGKVKSLEIKGNEMTAKVAGSRRTPYKVRISVPTFSEKQKSALFRAIADKPLLLAKLLNRELDAGLLPLAQSLGLQVFPHAWDDLHMHCSCPDWAVPCKHLAAAIYMLSREIDNDPFLVFSMHDADLVHGLQRFGVTIAKDDIQQVPTLNDLLTRLPTTRADSRADNTTDSTTDDAPDNDIVPSAQNTQDEKSANDGVNRLPKIYQRIDFAHLQDIVEPLVQLLPDNSPFYPKGDFKAKYLKQLKRCSKYAQRLLKQGISEDNCHLQLPRREQEIEQRLQLNHHSTLSLSIDASGDLLIAGEHHDIRTLDELIFALAKLNSGYLPDYQPSVAALHKAVFASLHLLASGTVIPEIVQMQDGTFTVRWLPASLDKNAKILCQQLDEALDFDVLMWRERPKGKRKEHFYALEKQAQTLLSCLLSRWISTSALASDDIFEALFFNAKAQAFDGIGENATAGSIQAWLSRYYLSVKRFQPVVVVNETPKHTAFTISLSINDSQASDMLPVPLSDVLAGKAHCDKRLEILQSLSLLSAFIDGLDDFIAKGATEPLRMNNDAFAHFLLTMIPAIRLLSVQTLLPQSLKTVLRPQASIKISRSSNGSGASFFGLNDLLQFDWQVAVGDKVIAPDEFEQLVQNASGLLYYKGQYLYVDAGDLARLQKQLTSNKKLSAGQLLQAALSESFEGAPVALTDDVRALIKSLASDSAVDVPTGLQATLRPYQSRGFAWMLKNSRIGFGSIIADDMGLGKTLQVITLLLSLKESGALDGKTKALVVVPTGLLTNWQAEIAKFAPALSCHLFHGSQREIKNFDSDILLTTYGVLRSDVATLKKRQWQLFAIDEAQNIKNASTAQSKAVKAIRANTRIAMSGTPVENRLSEFWSIMEFTNKGYLGTKKQFEELYAKPIQISNDSQAVEKFRRITAPFMLRRMKTDKSIISDLPDKIEQNQWAVLQEKQAALYESTVRDALEEIEAIKAGDEFERQGRVLQMILALKQICNHPSNYLKNHSKGNVDASQSGKSQLLLSLLDGIIESGEKALIFTQFREMGELLQDMIAQRFGETPMFYHGGCSVKARGEMVERFQNNRADSIFILSLKAAGTGLNLTAASHVIHYDLWWNPAVEAQATDRAYRIGQKKNVQVHRLITQNTFEEKIDAMIQGKKRLAEITVATGENWIGKLSNKELRELFS